MSENKKSGFGIPGLGKIKELHHTADLTLSVHYWYFASEIPIKIERRKKTPNLLFKEVLSQYRYKKNGSILLI